MCLLLYNINCWNYCISLHWVSKNSIRQWCETKGLGARIGPALENVKGKINFEFSIQNQFSYVLQIFY